jgi:hypothetical protein
MGRMGHMNAPTAPFAVESLATVNVTVLPTHVCIQHLYIERPSVVRYLGRIPEGKLEIALVHALEVGIVEMQSRREARRK